MEPLITRQMNIKQKIAARVAKELKDGDVVNLGIGLPTMVPNYLPEGVSVILQSENGYIGLGPVTAEDPDLSQCWRSTSRDHSWSSLL